MLLLLGVAVLLDDGPRTGLLSVQAEPTGPASADPTAAPTGAATPTATATAAPPDDPASCRFVLDGTPARPVLPPGPEPAPEPAVEAVLRTSAGDVDLVLDARSAPCAVHSFRHLAAAGFYDDTPCHRLVDRGIFVLQCGDPTGTGRGGPGYRFAEEALEDARYPRGTVAMVNSGPETTGSSFFLVYADSPLPPQYTPVGTVGAAGLAVLDAVVAAGTGPVDAAGSTPPLRPVQVLAVEVTPVEDLPDE